MMQQKICTTFLVLLLALCLSVFSRHARAAEIGECSPIPSGASIYWPVATGKKLLAAVKGLAVATGRIGLLEQKISLKEETIAWQAVRLKAADDTILKQGRAISSLRIEVRGLMAVKEKLVGQVSDLKSQRVWWLIGGAVGMAVVVAVVGVVVGVGC